MSAAESPSSGADHPDWDLLETSPAAFFGLPDVFDRKDLKRAYNGWLRRYKPEAHPEEFSRLHSAYKHLEGELSGGGGARPSGRAVGGGGSRGERAQDRATRVLEADVAQAFLDELELTSVRQAYQRRLDLLVPSPDDYVELALLADDLPPEARPVPAETAGWHPAQDRSAMDFVGWLIFGLARCPGDPTLQTWLACHCADGQATSSLRHELLAIAKVLSPADFGSITEPVWRGFLRVNSFTEFLEAWDACWQELGSAGSAHQAKAVLRLLPAAMWRADDAWVDAQIAWLEDDHALLGKEVDEQFGALTILRDHVRVAREFRQGGEHHERLADLIFDLTTLETQELDRRFIAWQLEAKRRVHSLLEEFPPGHPDCAAAYSVLERTCVTVESRQDDDGRGLPRERSEALVQEMFAAVAARTHGSLADWLWIGGRIAAWLGIALASIALIAGCAALAHQVHPRALAGGAVLGAIASVLLYRKKLSSMRAGFEFRGAFRCYRRIWREALVELMRRTQLPAVVTHDLLVSESTEDSLTRRQRRYRDWMLAFLTHDVGLGVWSLANRCG